ncbi:MAG: dockerin type I repeat-containing protein [Acutalibacteraceae bacterium]
MQKIIKRTLSCLLSFSVTVGAASMLSVFGGASAARYGDIDGNESVNSSDALTVLKYSVGIEELSNEALVLADVNADGNVNSSDALDILKYSVGILDSFKAEENEVDPQEVKASFKRALAGVQDKLPTYVLKETVWKNADEVKLSGAWTAFISDAKLKELEEKTKEDYNTDRKYTNIVRQKTEESASKMIKDIDLSDESKLRSVSCKKTSNGKYLLTVSFKDEKNPSSDSFIVGLTGLDDYNRAKNEVEQANSVEGVKATVKSFDIEYKNCVLVCEIDKATDEFVSIEWSLDIFTESKVTTAGMTVQMKTSGKRSSSYVNFGY